ncbi:IMP dehydrogenase [Sorangium sp. So ce406]|uniref:IMP dehydrogenase n=1 Tax=Sorangium sp. So ce406 TaxID=3133311 RepID=UPI003F5BF6FE
MGREAKGQKDPLEAVATLPPIEARTHEPPPATGWPAAQRADEPVSDAVAGSSTDSLPSPSPRWFDATPPDAAPAGVARPRRLWSIPLLVVALVLVATARSVVVRALLPLALVAAAVALLARGRRRLLPPAQASRRGLSLDGDQLVLQGKGGAAQHVLLATCERFGVTLLATPRRDRIVALLSSGAGMSSIGASFDGPSRRTFAALLDRASVVGSDDVGLDAIGPDGEPISLGPAALAALLDELTARSPGCLDRFLATDARGATLSLDSLELRAGGRVFDLTAPLEWRAFVFQEALGQALAVYQGTWVRQGTNEIVLVCLLPAMTPALDAPSASLGPLDRGALRDLRLMQGSPESPPPGDQRVAIDRLLMVPIRSALDKAPRPAAQAPRARA